MGCTSITDRLVYARELANAFLRDRPYRCYRTSDDAAGRCDGTTKDFIEWLYNRGVMSVEELSLDGFVQELDCTAANDLFRDFGGPNRNRFLFHVVALLWGRIVVDLTGHQYGRHYAPITVDTYANYRKSWGEMKRRRLDVEGRTNPASTAPCSRCAGYGMAVYSHVEDGRCFKCGQEPRMTQSKRSSSGEFTIMRDQGRGFFVYWVRYLAPRRNSGCIGWIVEAEFNEHKHLGRDPRFKTKLGAAMVSPTGAAIKPYAYLPLALSFRDIEWIPDDVRAEIWQRIGGEV